MNELERIKRRIHQKESVPSTTIHDLFFSFVYHSMISFMVIISLILGGLILTKTDLAVVKTQFSNGMIKVGDWIPFENWFIKPEVPVTTLPILNQLEGNYFSNGTNIVSSISNGIVVYINQDASYGYQIIIQNDNGILVTYSNLNQIQVNLEDRVLKNYMLGSYQDKFYMDFLEGETYISYEEAMAKN
ncbi:MAG: M23 family metallopeptidase [Erysipelotrichaceae bacterium]|nr:M23 family metallopeptidase [Erysipelotrichaceae bacterium]